MVPPGIAGYTSAAADYAEMSQLDREDEAKKILTELGYGPDNPLKLEIRFNTSENHKNTAVAIQEQLKPLGIEVTMINTDTKTHYGHLEQKGDFDLRAPAGSPTTRTRNPSSASRGRQAATTIRATTIRSSTKLMDEAAAAGGDPAERMKKLSEAEAILVNDVGNMPLLFYSFHTIVSPKLKGWEENVMDVHPSRFVSKE